jgi:hypothetical protein
MPNLFRHLIMRSTLYICFAGEMLKQVQHDLTMYFADFKCKYRNLRQYSNSDRIDNIYKD